MSLSIWFLTATCLVGEVPDMTGAPAPAHVIRTSMIAPSPDACCDHHEGFLKLRSYFGHAEGKTCDAADACAPGCRGESPGLFRRFLCWLGRRLCNRHCTNSCCENVCATTAPPCLPAPAAPIPPPRPVEPMPAVKRTAAKPGLSDTTEIAKEYLDKVANAADYSWVTGQLFYIHAEKGLWVVRYAPVDKEDRYGGSVVLAPATNMDSFRESDLVTVHGEILHEGRANKYLGGPPYRAMAVDLKERLPR